MSSVSNVTYPYNFCSGFIFLSSGTNNFIYGSLSCPGSKTTPENTTSSNQENPLPSMELKSRIEGLTNWCASVERFEIFIIEFPCKLTELINWGMYEFILSEILIVSLIQNHPSFHVLTFNIPRTLDFYFI